MYNYNYVIIQIRILGNSRYRVNSSLISQFQFEIAIYVQKIDCVLQNWSKMKFEQLLQISTFQVLACFNLQLFVSFHTPQRPTTAVISTMIAKTKMIPAGIMVYRLAVKLVYTPHSWTNLTERYASVPDMPCEQKN